MRYLNFILTLIAVLIGVLILQNCNNPVSPAQASSGITDVNILYIGGEKLYNNTIKTKEQ